MSRNFTPTTCRNCTRAFDLANPWVRLSPDSDFAECPHCGKRTEVKADSIRRARAIREEGNGDAAD